MSGCMPGNWIIQMKWKISKAQKLLKLAQETIQNISNYM